MNGTTPATEATGADAGTSPDSTAELHRDRVLAGIRRTLRVVDELGATGYRLAAVFLRDGIPAMTDAQLIDVALADDITPGIVAADCAIRLDLLTNGKHSTVLVQYQRLAAGDDE